MSGADSGPPDRITDDRPIILTRPEPSAEELAAIVAAVAVAAARRPATHEAEPSEPPPSRWARAARDEALRGPLRDRTGTA